jgi:hypothetical protein
MFFVPIILGIGAILVLVWGTPSSDGRMEPSDEPQRPALYKDWTEADKAAVKKQWTDAGWKENNWVDGPGVTEPTPPTSQTITHASSGSTVKPLITFTKDRKKEAWTQKDPAVMHNYTKQHAESSLGGDVAYQAA